MKTAGVLLREAEGLGIPWRDILEAEIRAERVLLPLNGDLAEGPVLAKLLALLPDTALESWRVRRALQDLRWRSRSGFRERTEARRQLRVFEDHLRGQSSGAEAATPLARHHLFAYRRILELAAIRRSASRCSGTREERAAAVEAATRCTPADARWAVEDDGDRSPAVDEAVRRAREEGYEVPRARNASETVLRLRELLRRRGLLRPRRSDVVSNSAFDGESDRRAAGGGRNSRRKGRATRTGGPVRFSKGRRSLRTSVPPNHHDRGM